MSPGQTQPHGTEGKGAPNGSFAGEAHATRGVRSVRKTIESSTSKALEQKSGIVARTKEDWPAGSLLQVGKFTNYRDLL